MGIAKLLLNLFRAPRLDRFTFPDTPFLKFMRPCPFTIIPAFLLRLNFLGFGHVFSIFYTSLCWDLMYLTVHLNKISNSWIKFQLRFNRKGLHGNIFIIPLSFVRVIHAGIPFNIYFSVHSFSYLIPWSEFLSLFLKAPSVRPKSVPACRYFNWHCLTALAILIF